MMRLLTRDMQTVMKINIKVTLHDEIGLPQIIILIRIIFLSYAYHGNCYGDLDIVNNLPTDYDNWAIFKWVSIHPIIAKHIVSFPAKN